MPHPAGERLVCEQCGAEIVFVKACPCPDTEPRSHSNLCCGREMRRLDAQDSREREEERRELAR